MNDKRRAGTAYADQPPSIFLTVNLKELSAAQRMDLLNEVDNARATLDAAYLRTVNGLVEALGGDAKAAVDLITVERKTSSARVGKDIAFAHSLAARHPLSFTALAGGRLNWLRADIIDRACSGLTEKNARAVDAAIHPRACDLSPGQLWSLLRTTILTIDPEGEAKRRAIAKKGRRVSVKPEPDGMATQLWHDSAENVLAVQDRIDTIARELASETDPRSMNELRADIMRDLLLGKYTSKTVAHVYVAGNASTILGLDDLPGTLRGYGAITAQQLREIAFSLQATWTGVLVDDGGYPKKMAEKKYRPSAALKEFVQLRDNTCTFPACYQVAHKTDYDHVRPWNRRGRTSSANGKCECRRHHRAKHSGRWRVRTGADGDTVWTSSVTRRSYSKKREPLVPVMAE
ncbi:HNH endonuclease signature motif containing protein [Amycolatopsis xylanica]|uniref:HNH endonuclease signature motif containing protein n=1 Tax=Amycolatopsis xylanica TaxID=589385 RepID=UPI001FE0EE9B|nr:HNH endonuclease signature motif containing protein [Amycolatopsis xylanica]